jgi:hypothetical protein
MPLRGRNHGCGVRDVRRRCVAKSRGRSARRGIAIRADRERIEAAFGQREQLVAQDVADRAKLALES